MVQRSLSAGSRNVVWVLRAPQRSWRRPWVPVTQCQSVRTRKGSVDDAKKSKTSQDGQKVPQNSPAPAGYFGTGGRSQKEPLGKAQMAAYWGCRRECASKLGRCARPPGIVQACCARWAALAGQTNGNKHASKTLKRMVAEFSAGHGKKLPD